MNESDAPARLPHLSQLFALELRREDGFVGGYAPVRPEGFVPGTRWLRTAVLAAIADNVSGHTPGGPGAPATGATMDLRVVVEAPPPTAGELAFRCRPLRVGRRIVVTQTEISGDGGPFARATATFSVVDQPLGAPAGRPPVLPVGAPSFDAVLGARVRDATTLLLDPSPRIGNPVMGTVHGGAQALFVELVAEHAVGARELGLVATDVDIRFLDRLRTGPMVGTGRPGYAVGGDPLAVVTLTDGGAGDRPVGHATVRFGRPAVA